MQIDLALLACVFGKLFVLAAVTDESAVFESFLIIGFAHRIY